MAAVRKELETTGLRQAKVGREVSDLRKKLANALQEASELKKQLARLEFQDSRLTELVKPSADGELVAEIVRFDPSLAVAVLGVVLLSGERMNSSAISGRLNDTGWAGAKTPLTPSLIGVAVNSRPKLFESKRGRGQPIVIAEEMKEEAAKEVLAFLEKQGERLQLEIPAEVSRRLKAIGRRKV